MSESGISREARVHAGGGEYLGPTDSGGFAGIQLSVAGQEAVDRAARLLAGVEGGVEKAVRSAISKAVARLRRSNVSAARERCKPLSALAGLAFRCSVLTGPRLTSPPGTPADGCPSCPGRITGG